MLVAGETIELFDVGQSEHVKVTLHIASLGGTEQNVVTLTVEDHSLLAFLDQVQELNPVGEALSIVINLVLVSVD